MALVVDTGPLLAAFDANDRHHAVSAALLRRYAGELVIPAPVLPEIDYWLNQRLRPSVALNLIGDIVHGSILVAELERTDYQRIYALCEQYADSDIGFVDAAVLAVVERLDEPKLATLDHRHFAMLRPAHVPALQLLPDLG